LKTNNKKKLIVILGPTAVGKTTLCIRLAQSLVTDVVYADSRQLYKGMRICTAQPTIEEMQGVKHHLLNCLSIDTPYDAFSYSVDALAVIDKLFETHNSIILSGGTGLYIDAVCHGIDAMPSVDHGIRLNLNSKLKTEGLSYLLERLALQDPEYYATVDKKNPRRILRALEVIESTGQPYSYFRNKNIVERSFEILKIGIKRDRNDLYGNINSRVELMVAEGLVKEVELLYPYRNYNATQTIGCRELFSHFDGLISLNEALTLIKQNTRRYAKRQLTWFQRDRNVMWYHADDYNSIIGHVQLFCK
jgi:tRNA dimethylallyltransferase